MEGKWERILVKEPEGKGNLVGQSVDVRITFKYS
jgi:hypothetical protein